MTGNILRKSLVLFGLGFGSLGVSGCGVSQQELVRQTKAAYREGYVEGERAEQARCHAKIEQLEVAHREDKNRLEQAHREEKTRLENKILGMKIIFVGAVGSWGLLLFGAGISAAIYYAKRRRRNGEDNAEQWQYRKPPPSVTQEGR